MGWDEVCILCGIRPYGGPVWFGASEESATQIAQEVVAAGFTDLPPDALAAMLLDLFQTNPDDFDPRYKASVHPGYDKDCIAIGHFDRTGGYEPCRHAGRALHPPGDNVQVRRVADNSSGASFNQVVELVRGERVTSAQATTCDTYGGCACNLWLHVACWGHLQHWLACSLPPRAGRSGEPLPLAGELYEIAASRAEPQQECRGALPAIDYGGTLDAFMEIQYQDYILGPRRGVRHLTRALQDGLRGAQLVPALMEDVRFWMWARPDEWPRAPDPASHDALQNEPVGEPAPQPAALCMLPNELLPELLQHCELDVVFALASTCRELYTRVLARSTLADTLHRAAENRGSALRWVLPAPNLREEWAAACDAMRTWLPVGAVPPLTFDGMEFDEDDEDDADFVPPESESDEEDDDEDSMEEDEDEDALEEHMDADADPSQDDAPIVDASSDADDLALPISDVPIPLPPDPSTLPLPPLPLFNPAFPLAAFLRAFRTSASMRARRRRWGLVKQWDALFAAYRRDGWERDVFTPSGTVWAQGEDGVLRCQCTTKDRA
ncbi:hypothetical protein PsYK624_128390 [Phanerochaete sordida]|uniref:F-box domain-containing protein n=1 Tax=Phanerochaete sordida TaxID=48140 RepID=A0A9P3LJG1_9APHY|nr:hypothetical protein PsYK624_128390 [Phanerochaete sordida]